MNRPKRTTRSRLGLSELELKAAKLEEDICAFWDRNFWDYAVAIVGHKENDGKLTLITVSTVHIGTAVARSASKMTSFKNSGEIDHFLIFSTNVGPFKHQ